MNIRQYRQVSASLMLASVPGKVTNRVFCTAKSWTPSISQSREITDTIFCVDIA